ncbi:MAG: sugar transferase [Planctomycetota bacterium]|nr:sugar transferase [Planctomycetota bacterium]
MTRAGTTLRRHFEPLVLSAQVLVDLVTVVGSCLFAWWIREQFAPEGAGTPLEAYRSIFAITSAVCLISFHRFGMYSPIKSLLNVEEFKAVTKATLSAFLVVLSLLVLLRDTNLDAGSGPFWGLLQAIHELVRLTGGSEQLSRVTLILAFGVIHFSILVGRFASFKVIQNLHRRGIGNRNVIVIGTGKTAQALQRKFLLVPTLGLNFVGFVSEKQDEVGDLVERARVLGSLDRLSEIMSDRKVGEVFVALPEAEESRVMAIVGQLEALGTNYYVVPRFYHLMRYKIRIEDLDSIPLIARVERRDPLAGRLAKRSFDLVVSTIVLLLALPLLFISVLLIRRDSAGPVFFRQIRVGLNGLPFEMLKFRTMYSTDCEDAEAPETEQDPRVTRIGRLLRRYSLDELPNFINVLRGEMSVVGPRPEMPFIVAKYTDGDRERLRAKPGVTGLWQISYARQMAIHDNLDYDLYYIENQSFLLDLVIVALTGVAVVKGTGAY